MLAPDNSTKLMNGVTPGSLATAGRSLVAANVGWAVAMNAANGSPAMVTWSVCAPMAVLSVQITVALPVASVLALAGMADPSAGLATNVSATPLTGFPN